MDELKLHRYLDGRLDEREHQAVEAELKTDPASRRTLEALREEARLIGAALEAKTEPSRRIGDRVVAQLHLEERSRAATMRNWLFFRRALKVAAVAALFAVCFYLIKPQTPAGSFLSGTHATVSVHGEKRDAQKGANLYDSDEIEAAKGQFVRLSLASGAIVDIDEFSNLSIEKSGSAPVLRMTRGRMGISVGDTHHAVQIELPQGTVTIQAGSRADIWLPEQSAARIPELFFAPNAKQPVASVPAVHEITDAIVTVFKGYAQIDCAKKTVSYTARSGMRAHVSKTEIQPRVVNIAGSRVLDVRGDDSIHVRDNLAPAEWTLLGLMEKPRFEVLGHRWGLAGDETPRIGEALKQLDAAMQCVPHAERAEKLAAGQQALHQACETLAQNDERRRMGVILEGLAHFEDGMARLAAGGRKDSEPRVSFDAARFAFDSALADATPAANAASDWRTAFNGGGAAPDLTTLSKENQAALYASFWRAAALYWHAHAQVSPPQLVVLDCEESTIEIGERVNAMRAAAAAFSKLHDELGHSVEGVAALLGEVLCEISAGDAPSRHKALDALHVIVSKPAAGTDGAAHDVLEGIRQAALIELVRLNACGPDARKTLDAAHDFELLYPLEAGAPLTKEFRAMLVKGLEAQKNSALKEKRYDQAVEACDMLLIALDEADGHWIDAGQIDPNGGVVRHVAARLDLVEALAGAKDWLRASGEVVTIDKQLPAELRARFESLQTLIRTAQKK